jgi:hypothetical protein
MILKLPGQDKIRNRMRMLQAQRAGADVFIDTVGTIRAARPLQVGDPIFFRGPKQSDSTIPAYYDTLGMPWPQPKADA